MNEIRQFFACIHKFAKLAHIFESDFVHFSHKIRVKNGLMLALFNVIENPYLEGFTKICDFLSALPCENGRAQLVSIILYNSTDSIKTERGRAGRRSFS